MPSAGMKQRVFLVYTEHSTIRIGEAGFKQLANVVSFRVADAIFPRRMYIFCHGEMSFKIVLTAKYKGKYALFLPKLSTHISSKNIAFLPVAIMTREVYRCIQSQKSGIWLHHVCTGCIIR